MQTHRLNKWRQNGYFSKKISDKKEKIQARKTKLLSKLINFPRFSAMQYPQELGCHASHATPLYLPGGIR